MSRFGVGLLLGFAVGVGFALAFLVGDGDPGSPTPTPSRIPPIPRIDRPHAGPAAVTPEADGRVVESRAAVPANAGRKPPDAKPSKETLLSELSSISHVADRQITNAQVARAGRLAAALAKRDGLVPADLVARLLAHGNPELRKAGIQIAWRVQPGLIAELTQVMFEDQDHHIRYLALHMLAVCGERRPEVLQDFLRAARSGPALLRRGAIEALGHRARGGVTPVIDFLFECAASSDAVDRMVAIETLSPLAGKRPELNRIILAAVRDENTDIRTVAIRQLGHLGDAGATIALELLASGEFRPDQLQGLAEAVVVAGRTGEALEKQLGPEIEAAVLVALYQTWDEEDPELLSPVKGRLRRIYRSFRPGEDYGYEPLFGLAIAAEEYEFVREIAIGEAEPEAARLQAIEAFLQEEKTLELALSIAETILGRATERAVFRTAVVEMIDPADFEDPALKRRAADLMRKLAKADPSPWVRAAAMKRVPGD